MWYIGCICGGISVVFVILQILFWWHIGCTCSGIGVGFANIFMRYDTVNNYIIFATFSQLNIYFSFQLDIGIQTNLGPLNGINQHFISISITLITDTSAKLETT